MTTKRGFGFVRKLPSGRYQASYLTPDNTRRNAPTTFRAKREAELWVAKAQDQIATGKWREAEAAEAAHHITIGEWCDSWMAYRKPKLMPRTFALYQDLLQRLILPELGPRSLTALRASEVDVWFTGLGTDHPSQNSKAYGLLRTIYRHAVNRDHMAVSPCRIPGAGRAPKRTRPLFLISLDDAPALLATLAAELPERLALMPQLGFWLGLRFGEATELRRKDVDLAAGVIHVQRGVVWVPGNRKLGTVGHSHIGKPKSDAGIRDVQIPSIIADAVADHLAQHVRFGGAEALLFHAAVGPAAHLTQATWAKIFKKAAAAAGCPTLTFHDLRHAHANAYTELGATTKEVMAQLGHATPAMALHYQHATQRRADLLNRRLSGLPDTPTDNTPNIVSLSG